MPTPTKRLKIRVEFEQTINWNPEENPEPDATRAATDLLYWSASDPEFPDLGTIEWPPDKIQVKGEWVEDEEET